MRPGYKFEALDEACASLRAMAKEHGLERLDVTVRQDGRVEIHGLDCTGNFRARSAWVVRADLQPGSSHQFPSAAMCDWLEQETRDRSGTDT